MFCWYLLRSRAYLSFFTAALSLFKLALMSSTTTSIEEEWNGSRRCGMRTRIKPTPPTWNCAIVKITFPTTHDDLIEFQIINPSIQCWMLNIFLPDSSARPLENVREWTILTVLTHGWLLCNAANYHTIAWKCSIKNSVFPFWPSSYVRKFSNSTLLVVHTPLSALLLLSSTAEYMNVHEFMSEREETLK